ncbi:MAG: cation-translocating P-type ATPase [Elusimicrobiota bacterium]
MTNKKLVILVDDISCSNCVKKIEDNISKMGGVRKVNVYLVSKIISLEYDNDSTTSEKIINRIKNLGYNPLLKIEQDFSSKEFYAIEHQSIKKRLFVKFLLSIILTLTLIFLDFFKIEGIAPFLISFIIWLYCGWHFHKGFLGTIKNFEFDMDSLVSISTSAGFFYNSLVFFFPSFLNKHSLSWYDIGIIITFLNLGRYLEILIKDRSAMSPTSMIKSYPGFANIEVNGDVRKIKVEEVKEGDLLIIKKGEQVPADCMVVEGNTYVDESNFTGESNLIYKIKGDLMYATTINLGETVKAVAQKTGDDTLFMQIVSLVDSSQLKKTKISMMINRITAYFVPFVILISIASGIFWSIKSSIAEGIYVFSSVLVVACPCAMGLSIPIALFIGFTRASKSGFIINNPDVIDDIRKVNLVILDKPGTLTCGALDPTKVVCFRFSEYEFISLLKSVFSQSSNILARNFTKYYKDFKFSQYSVESFIEDPGKGMTCYLDGKKVIVGNIEFMLENGVGVPVDIKEEILNLNLSHFLLSIDGRLEGYVIFSDRLRENTCQLIKEFERRGIKIVIASGDSKEIVANIAKDIGVKEYYAPVLPQDKHSIVLKYKILGYNVMMVGNGLNDTAAISNADVGVALKRGSDIVATSSDIILIKEDLSQIFKMMDLANAIRKIISQNLIWAFAYNILLIPVAMGALKFLCGFTLPPYLSVIAMILSSISVIINSMRLYKIKI